MDDRVRVQLLGVALNAFSQGVAYYHAGIDTLRSKSMDRNSYNSGDWFNRLDWTYSGNNFGVGSPLAGRQREQLVDHPAAARQPDAPPGRRGHRAAPATASATCWPSAQSSTLFRLRTARRREGPAHLPQQRPGAGGHGDGRAPRRHRLRRRRLPGGALPGQRRQGGPRPRAGRPRPARPGCSTRCRPRPAPPTSGPARRRPTPPAPAPSPCRRARPWSTSSTELDPLPGGVPTAARASAAPQAAPAGRPVPAPRAAVGPLASRRPDAV